MSSRLYRPSGKLVQNAGIVTPDWIPQVPNVMDDEFEGNALDAKWSWFNQGAAGVTLDKSAAILSLATEATGTWRGVQQTLPVGNWKFQFKLANSVNANNSQTFGCGIFENSTRKSIYKMRSYTGSTFQWAVNYYTNDTTYGSTPWSSTTLIPSGWPWRQWLWVNIEYDGTNYIFSFSSDGITFVTVATLAKASYFTADRIGFAIRNGNSGSTFTGLCDYFRRIS